MPHVRVSSPRRLRDLEAAFEALIIGGRRSFVVTADGADRFAIAVRWKLLLEIADAGPTKVGNRRR